ncbi:SH3 domain-containing protein [Paraferrimonas sp. SM1919]|uniref:SH3 domain-containing protein n=1 Tax=Paraferrimonas sp. SM1919 TaxID=2662263 RepID=UPI0013D735CB|nr:SH3 domain-containing protein [Paraferrimonas sp. SM1919]
MLRLGLLLIAVFFSGQSLACGKVSWALQAIMATAKQDKGPMAHFSEQDLYQSLAKVGGTCQQLTDDQPIENQQALLKLLLDPKQQIWLERYGQQLFVAFDCLDRVKQQVGFQQVYQQYQSDRCPEQSRLIVISHNGANLRAEPIIANNKLTVLPKNTVLKPIAKKGDWYQVEVLKYNHFFTPECKFKTPCKIGYVHQDLLE